MNKVLYLALVLLLFLSVLTLSAFSLKRARAESTLNTPSKDAAICSSSMDVNDGADYRLDFGFDNYSDVTYRFLVQFDLPPTLSGENIASATLKLWGPTPWSSGIPSGEALRACRVTHDWVEGTGKSGAPTQDGVTWNEYNYNDGLATATNNWDTPGGDYTLEDSSTVIIPPYPMTWTCLNITVTNIVKGWASSAYPNLGFLIKLGNESGAYKGGVFDSREYGEASVLKLEINYTVPTPTPTPTPTSTPTPTPTPTPMPTPTPTSTPTPTPIPTQGPEETPWSFTPTPKRGNVPNFPVYEGAVIGVAVVAGVGISSFVVVKKRRVSEKSLRRLSSREFQDWVLKRLDGKSASSKDSALGIDGFTMGGQPVMIKQSDGIGMSVIESFASALARNKAPNGVIVAFSFGSDAIRGKVRAKMNYRLEIQMLTVDELIYSKRAL
jgi:hypothetical protein